MSLDRTLVVLLGLRWLLIGATAYLALGGAVHYVILPEFVPDAFIPRAGDVVEDPSSGERGLVLERRDGLIWGEFVIAPGGAGPPVHIHTSSPEALHVVSGEMSAIVGDERRKVGPGESVFVPPGTPHTWFNDGDTPAVSRPPYDERYGTSETLVLCITQLWQMLNDVTFLESHSMLLQISLMAPYCDIWDADTPVWAQRVAFYFVAPTARLLGYRSAYAKYVLHPL
jgi:quercetin dioxygenase-like cupin family protein